MGLMIVMTITGLVSVVADRDDPLTLVVRARQPGHIEHLALAAGRSDVAVSEDQYEHAPYQARVTRHELTDMLYAQVAGIDYPLFRTAVRERGGRALARVYAQAAVVFAALGMGSMHGRPRPKASWPDMPDDPPLSPEDAALAAVPDDAWQDDGSVRP